MTNSKAVARAVACSATTLAVGLGTVKPAAADYEPHKYTEPGTGLVLEYNLYVPNQYDPAQKYPLMVFLHAAGQDSDLPRNLGSSGKGWTGSFLDNGDDEKYPSFFLVPISQTNRSGWGDGRSDAEKFEGRLTIVVLKELVASGEYNIDADRLYVTGPSMGGRGTWDMIEKNPGLFAAAIPAAAPGLDDAAKVVGENIWAINGENDSTVEDNRETIAAIRALGGNPIYTELAGHGHDTWRQVYPSDAFMAWVYAQRRGVPWWHVSEVPVIPEDDRHRGGPSGHPLTRGQPAVTGPTGPEDVPPGVGGAGGMSGAGATDDGGAGGALGGASGSGGVAGEIGVAEGGASGSVGSGGSATGAGGTPPSVPGTGVAGTPSGGMGSGPMPSSPDEGGTTSCRYSPHPPGPGPAPAAWLAALSLVVAARRKAR